MPTNTHTKKEDGSKKLGLTWKEWKKHIRAHLDAQQEAGHFDVETDTIFYFDVVAGEALDMRRHKTLTGIGSEKPPVIVEDQPEDQEQDDE